MNVMFALLSKRAFSNVLEGVNLNNFSLAPLPSQVQKKALPSFVLLHDMLLVTSTRNIQTTTVSTIWQLQNFHCLNLAPPPTNLLLNQSLMISVLRNL